MTSNVDSLGPHSWSEDEVRANARIRIAAIFRVAVADLADSTSFGGELRASFVSDFARNEFDIVSDDLRDVADRTTLRKIATGRITVRTVGEYCDHMACCWLRRPEEVQYVLTSPVAKAVGVAEE